MKDQKLRELERRILRLEKESEFSPFSYYAVQKNGEEESLNHTFTFDFETSADTCLKLTVKTQTNISEEIGITIFVNGIACSFGKVNGENGLKESILPFEQGKNEVKVELLANTAFIVKQCTLETFGNINYFEKECVLMNINEQNRSLILFISNGEAVVKEYKGEELTLLYSENGIKSGTFCKINDRYLLVLIDENGNGTVKEMSANFAPISEISLDNELISVCSFGGDFASIFAVRGNKIYRYNINKELTIVKRNTGYFGKKVTANPIVRDYIIITDYDGSAKLIKL